MEKAAIGRRWLICILTILTSAVCFYFSTGFHSVWILAWLAPWPVLVFAFRSRPPIAGGAAFLAFLLGSLNLLTYLLSMVPAGIVLVVLVLQASVFAGSVLAGRSIALRTGSCGVLAFPVIWTSYEFLMAIVSPHGTFGSLAYTQMDVLPLIQISSIAGIWGITFLLLLIPSSLAYAWNFRCNRRQAWPALSFSLAALIVSLLFGWIRLSQPSSAPLIRVGMAVTDRTIRQINTDQSEVALSVVDAYVGRVRELARQGAQVVVLPEKFVGVRTGFAIEIYRRFATVAREEKIILNAGLNQIASSGKRNTSLVYGPDGRILAEYDKVHLVPGWEDGTIPGKSLAVFKVNGDLWGTAICKDMDFHRLGRQYAQAGVKMMLVPAWDFIQDARFHSRMAVLRGVEGGYAIIRTAQEGLVQVSDDRGRILAEHASYSAPEVLLLAEVPLGQGSTYYARTGDWFAFLNLFLLTGFILRLATKYWNLRKFKE
jgi:apolipoprotein N-acyltransferase